MIGDGKTRSGQGVTKLQVEMTAAGCRCRPHLIYCLPVTCKKTNLNGAHVSDVRLAIVHQGGPHGTGGANP